MKEPGTALEQSQQPLRQKKNSTLKRQSNLPGLQKDESNAPPSGWSHKSLKHRIKMNYSIKGISKVTSLAANKIPRESTRRNIGSEAHQIDS